MLLVPVTLAGLLTCLGTATASAATCVTWSGTPASNSAVPDNVLTATSVLSPCDAWAVGWNSGAVANQTLIEHWDGTRWNGVSSPSPGTTDNVLSGVSVISPSNAWAVGAYSDGGVARLARRKSFSTSAWGNPVSRIAPAPVTASGQGPRRSP